jgi:hypothetical protein
MTRSPTTTHRVAAELAAQMAVVSTSILTALRNLDRAQAGYPTSVVGADPSTTESGDGLAVLERAALVGDEARDALDRLHRLVADLRVPTVELYSLTLRWSYAPYTPPLRLEDNDEWCDSCLRLQRCEPRYRGRYCWFCHDMRSTFGRLPSLALLERHHRGERITTSQRAGDRVGKR